MAGGTRDEDGDERRARRARSTRDRRGRSTASTRRARTPEEDRPGPTSRARRTSPGESDRTDESRGRRSTQDSGTRGRRTSTAAPDDASAGSSGAASVRRAEARDRTRRRGEPARPDSSNRASRVRTSRDSGRPTTRRPRSDAVRARRTEPGERRVPSRARYLTRRWIAALVVLSVAVVAYLVMFTSLLGVRSVEVIGAKEISKDAVLKAAAIENGTPMVRLDADEAAARVAKLPRVFEVVVERSWPSTVEIIVTERAPVAILRSGAEIHLVDSTGLDYAKVATPPAGLPTLAMSNVRPDDPATKAAVTVLGAIPKQLKAQVTTITAKTQGDVQMTLTDGRLIKWGDARDNARKAAVLAAVLTRPGKTYDVATPDFPTVAG
jgi:cell division protein FtsQ